MDDRFLKYAMDYEMFDGTTVKAVLTNRHIISLKTIDKGLYHTVCNTVFNGVEDFDIEKFAKIIYGAYVCANPDEHMDYDDFLNAMNPDVAYNSMFAAELASPSKKRISGEHSPAGKENQE